jgi:quinoprotein glucose dehydrogenase
MHKRVIHLVRLVIILASLAVVAPSGARLDAQSALHDAEWRAVAGTNASTKYSPLDQINKTTVKNLRIVWRQSATPVEVRGAANAPAPTNYQHTPLMVGGLIYMSTGNGSVAALNAGTGKVAWVDTVPTEQLSAQPRGEVVRHDEPGRSGVIVVSGRGAASRGIAYWTDTRDARVIALVGQSLVALNAKTGQRYPDFGEGGSVDLKKGYTRPADSFRWGSSPIVVGDIIVIGGIGSAGGRSLPGDIRGYDVRTGALRWTFNTIPRSGEFGNDTWLKRLVGARRSGRRVELDECRRRARIRLSTGRIVGQPDSSR